VREVLKILLIIYICVFKEIFHKKMKSIFSIICLIFFGWSIGNSQELCGTTLETQLQMQPQPTSLRERNSVTYVPIRFHLVADNEGNGLPNISRVLDQMTKLNSDFKESGIQFYLAGNGFFNTINNINIYEDPRINGQDLISNKNGQAINVFVTKNANGSESLGTTFGYYAGGSHDYIVMINSELNGTSQTLSHEMGHFFTLRHTFFGWEEEPYSVTKHGNPLSIRIAPSYGAEVELVNKSNCATAADQICDTSPDYNFGFGANGCNYTTQIKDPNNDLVVVDKFNQMGYFVRCQDLKFTSGQNQRMINSIMSPTRNYVRVNYNPVTSSITEKPTIIDLPAVISTYNNVFVQWKPVQGATHYLVEFTDGRSYRYSIQNGSSVRVFDLEANKNYFVRIRAFNEYFTETLTEFKSFKTGNILSSVTDNKNDRFDIDVIGNPISKGNQNIQFNIYSTMSFTGTIKLFDVQGRMIHIENKQIENGTVLHQISTSNLNAGLHILSFESEYGRITKKLLIN
jgi:hypothetical protein